MSLATYFQNDAIQTISHIVYYEKRDTKVIGTFRLINQLADSFPVPIIAAIIGIIRAIRAAITKVTFRPVKLKARPIMRGPMVMPNGIMVLCMAIKPARCSKGATPAAMIRWLGRFKP